MLARLLSRPRPLMSFVVCAACTACAPRAHPQPTTGTIAGLARDRDTGDPIANAEIRVTAERRTDPHVATSSARGLYDVGRLAPGRYRLVATFAAQPIEVANVDVRAGAITIVDVTFTLGRPDPISIDYGDIATAIQRYHPPHLTRSVSIVEGTVNDSETRERVVGAVVTAIPDGDVGRTEHTISDDAGRFRFDALPPGLYAVSAYYSVSGRGQIEVRRSGVAVAGGEGVVVPLWIEMTR